MQIRRNNRRPTDRRPRSVKYTYVHYINKYIISPANTTTISSHTRPLIQPPFSSLSKASPANNNGLPPIHYRGRLQMTPNHSKTATNTNDPLLADNNLNLTTKHH